MYRNYTYSLNAVKYSNIKSCHGQLDLLSIRVENYLQQRDIRRPFIKVRLPLDEHIITSKRYEQLKKLMQDIPTYLKSGKTIHDIYPPVYYPFERNYIQYNYNNLTFIKDETKSINLYLTFLDKLDV
jgi:hypothetical protein